MTSLKLKKHCHNFGLLVLDLILVFLLLLVKYHTLIAKKFTRITINYCKLYNVYCIIYLKIAYSRKYEEAEDGQYCNVIFCNETSNNVSKRVQSTFRTSNASQ